MSYEIEKMEKSIVKLTFTVDKDKFDGAIDHAYNKVKNEVNIQGFRKGKAPKQMIISQYGKEVFYDDAIDFVMPELLENALKAENLELVSRPYARVISNDENGAVIEVQIFVKPEVEVKDYKGVEIAKISDEITEEEVNAHVDRERDKSARIVTVERSVEDGDVVSIDFEGFLDGVPFEGGKGEDYDLTIGSKTFIDTFEEQLVGINKGEETTVKVTFPEEYGQADLAGKAVEFKVKVNEIKVRELPELNDEFAAEVSEFETLVDYINSVKEELAVSKKASAKAQKENAVMEKLVEITEIDLPIVMVENQIQSQLQQMEQQLQAQGISLEQYLQLTGGDIQSLREMYREQSDKQVRGRLILEAIADAEKFDFTEEEVLEEVRRIAELYQMPYENLESTLREEDKEGIKKDLGIKKALDLVAEAAKEV